MAALVSKRGFAHVWVEVMTVKGALSLSKKCLPPTTKKNNDGRSRMLRKKGMSLVSRVVCVFCAIFHIA